jgi:hypothetical protein
MLLKPWGCLVSNSTFRDDSRDKEGLHQLQLLLFRRSHLLYTQSRSLVTADSLAHRDLSIQR